MNESKHIKDYILTIRALSNLKIFYQDVNCNYSVTGSLNLL